MEVEEAPATPTGETFEMFDGESAIQNRKRRRSSLRRVSFAEQPSIHVFARDDDYETPPEGTMSHLSTPTSSVSRSPQRRSERLLASTLRGARQQDENDMDKENAPVSVGSNARQSRRGRRPLAVRDMQKEKAQEEFLKPSNWLDDHENSAFGSCDDNTGPVDIRHITFDNQRVDAEDDMTMDSQAFHTRMSLLKQQPLLRLSEATVTPGMFSDMESIHGQHTEKFQAWHERQAALGSKVSRQVQHEEPTWHRGDGRVSDMSESSFDELSILRDLVKRRTAAKESSIHDSAENSEDGAHSQGNLSNMEVIRTGSRLLDMDDDAISISPQSTGGGRKSLGDEMELDPDTTGNLRDSELQGIQNIKQQGQSGLQARDGFVSQGTEPERLLSAPDENTESMVITLAWNERAPPQHTSVPTKSSDSAKSFLWVDKDQSMDMSDVDTMERYQEGITEAMPKLASVLGGYECDSPSAEPLSRILQRKSSTIDGEEDSPVYGVTAEIDHTVKKVVSSRKAGDVAPTGGLEEKEIVPAYRGLEDGTDDFHFNTSNKRSGFQNPEDTFSFRGHRKNTRDTSVSPSMEQNATNSKGQEKVNLSVPQNPVRSCLDEDSTGEYTGRDDWRAEVSSDMSTTPISPRVNYLQRLGTKPQSVPETGLTDSPSFQDGITAAIPNVQDLLAADARTPASELGWNPRKIDWGAQESTRKVSRGEEGLRQPGIDQIEDETMHSMPDRLCTPPSQAEKSHAFEDVTEMAADTLHQVSHSKEIRNSVASKMLLRMMSLQDDARAQAESSPDEDFQQSLRRTLQFQPEADSQLQSQSLRGDHAEQRMDPDGAMDVESSKNADEETNSTESNVETLRQESRRQKLLQEMKVAEERLLALERRSEELRNVAKDCHKVIAERCQNDSCYKANESPAFCSETHVCELKKRCQLLTCMLGSDLKTTKIGDDQVLHEFRYWSLLTHSISERKKNRIEATASSISIDLNEESINQLYRDMNASLAWRWFLSGNEERVQPQSYHAQGVNLKVVMLMDLMEEVNKCRKYLVIPRFRLQGGAGLQLGLQFSNSELLFDFLLLLNMRQVNHMRYELDGATQRNQKLDCIVEMESAGRYIGRKITEAEIKSAVASVVPGRQLLLRVCSSINAHIMRKE